VAYFSMEFGIASFLKIYSGGLGILSGDHLKSTSDLGIPLVGVGLFYTHGYFSQGINADGWQIEQYLTNNSENLPLELVLDQISGETLIFSVPLAAREVKVKAWKTFVGQIPLYLLDTNIPGQNSREDCEITSELYGGDSDTRIKQEIVLGFGGARLLRLLGHHPTIYHMNEGHSSFVSLERISQIIEDSEGKKPFPTALQTVKNSTVFTTHTPVPAGIDIFTRGQIEHYLSQSPKRLGISVADLFSLGQETTDSNGFNMAVFAIRTSSMVNGVSNLHRHIARKLWEKVLEEEKFDLSDFPEMDKKTGKRMRSVTNGVHIPSWISDRMAELLTEHCGPGLLENNWQSEAWRTISKIPSEKLWEVRQKSRTSLVEYVQQKVGKNLAYGFDSNALTIGFARRFATYKRATLLFSDPQRLERILKDLEKPIQFIFAGKAHPRDHDGKKMIQEIVSFSKKEPAGGKIVFIPDYDIDVARHMVQGVDLWLNNPRRPLEASGTSGMKVLCNGGINLSVLDGWWDEAYTPSNGWAIGTGTSESNYVLQDRQDAESLYDLLQNHVIPEFYDRSGGLPAKWIDRMKRSMSNLTPRFSSSRMVIEYAENFYFKNLSRNSADNENDLETHSPGQND
jgi:glycogen phosphorylase